MTQYTPPAVVDEDGNELPAEGGELPPIGPDTVVEGGSVDPDTGDIVVPDDGNGNPPDKVEVVVGPDDNHVTPTYPEPGDEPGPTPPTAQKITLSYEENGGKDLADVTAAKGSTVELATPPREGWTFEGWYADAALTQYVGAGGDAVRLDADRTVWAKWSRTGVPGVLTEDHVNYVLGREGEDGSRTIQPLADVTRAEVAAMVYRLLDADVRAEHATAEDAFPDTDAGAWYAEPVATLAAMGAIHGVPQADGGTLFEPDRPITRAELTAIVTRLDGDFADDGTVYGRVPFGDVPRGHWAYATISFAVNVGWLMGDGAADAAFRPDDTITRAETMAILNRVLQRLPYSEEDLLPGSAEWPDNQDESQWYWIVVEEATNNHAHEVVEGSHGVHEEGEQLSEHERWTALMPNVAW